MVVFVGKFVDSLWLIDLWFYQNSYYGNLQWGLVRFTASLSHWRIWKANAPGPGEKMPSWTTFHTPTWQPEISGCSWKFPGNHIDKWPGFPYWMLVRESAEKLFPYWMLSRKSAEKFIAGMICFKTPRAEEKLLLPQKDHLRLLLFHCRWPHARTKQRPALHRVSGWRGVQIKAALEPLDGVRDLKSNPAKVVGDLFCLNVELSYSKHVDMYLY